jgi:hypothetical protein
MPMKERLSRTGVKAGRAKRLQLLSRPPASATSDMKRMYGKVIRVSATVSSNFSASAAKPGAAIQTNTGAAAMPIAVMTNSAMESRLAT